LGGLFLFFGRFGYLRFHGWFLVIVYMAFY
jgi:hypothetical protein